MENKFSKYEYQINEIANTFKNNGICEKAQEQVGSMVAKIIYDNNRYINGKLIGFIENVIGEAQKRAGVTGEVCFGIPAIPINTDIKNPNPEAEDYKNFNNPKKISAYRNKDVKIDTTSISKIINVKSFDEFKDFIDYDIIMTRFKNLIGRLANLPEADAARKMLFSGYFSLYKVDDIGFSLKNTKTGPNIPNSYLKFYNNMEWSAYTSENEMRIDSAKRETQISNSEKNMIIFA